MFNSYIKILHSLGILWMIASPTLQSLSAQSEDKVLKFGFYSSIVHENNIREIDESFKRWVEAVQKHTKVEWFSKAIINYKVYKSRLDLMNDVRNRKIDFMNFSTLDFFDLKTQNTVVPLLTPSKRLDDKFEKYILIARKEAEYDNISAITKEAIVIPKTYSMGLMNTWIRVELKERVNKIYFPDIQIKESSKTESEMLYSVFFKSTELCVVREGTYLFACELNPQLKRNLKIIATSPNLINNFLAYSREADPAFYEILEKEGLQLHKWVDGKQLLNLMQAECMHKIYPEDLKQTEILINSYKRYYK